jgi:magnesium transporter
VVAGIVMVLIGDSYQNVLSERIELVFFIPMILYMSDSIGTETLALFVRELALRRLSIKRILLKEVLVGLFLGVASGLPMGLFCYLWFREFSLAATVAIAMVINGMVAVLIGMLLPVIFSKLGRDPALGTDEITTALSDDISMLIYLAVATALLFGL